MCTASDIQLPLWLQRQGTSGVDRGRLRFTSRPSGRDTGRSAPTEAALPGAKLGGVQNQIPLASPAQVLPG